MRSFFKNAFLNLFFKPKCLLCGGSTDTAGALCPACFSSLDVLRPPFCPSCGRPVQKTGGTECAACMYVVFPFFPIRSAVAYDAISRRLIFALKYGGSAEAGKLMARLMTRAGGDALNGADVLIPVPLHRFRLLSRRFNQSVVLAAGIAAETDIPVDDISLKRTRHTKKQGHFSKEKRTQNVKGAFAVTTPDAIKGKKIVLIDDVMTTGATLRACADVLKKAGAAEVRVLTFARVLT